MINTYNSQLKSQSGDHVALKHFSVVQRSAYVIGIKMRYTQMTAMVEIMTRDQRTLLRRVHVIKSNNTPTSSVAI